MRIIMLLTALMAVAMLSACNSAPSDEGIKPAASALPEPPKDGAEKIAREFPVDQYPGSTIQVSSSKGAARMTMLTSKGEFSQIVQYYKDFFVTQKWTVITVDDNPSDTSIVAAKGKEKLTVQVTTDAEAGKTAPVTILLTKEPRE